MKKHLPWPIPEKTWWLVTAELRQSGVFRDLDAEFRRTCKAPGWNPGIVKMGGHMVAVDYCASNGELHSYATTLRQDHPFLAVLNALPHVPRAVKHIYRADVRLRYLRADELWDFMADWSRAEAAWNTYRENVGR